MTSNDQEQTSPNQMLGGRLDKVMQHYSEPEIIMAKTKQTTGKPVLYWVTLAIMIGTFIAVVAHP